MSQNAYQIITDRIMEAMKQGLCPWRKPWTTKARAFTNAVSGRPYRGVNPVILGMESNVKGYGDPRWITFNQAKGLGGCVRKGERGTPVVFWKLMKKEQEDPATGEKETVVLPVLRHWTVFNVEQCEGLDLAPVITEAPAFSPVEAAEQIVAAMPAAPVIRHGGDRACYSKTEDRVSMPLRGDFKEATRYYSTLFHELTHSTGHASRLGRFNRQEYQAHFFGDENYSREELVAELGSAFLCAEAGLDGYLEPSAAYIAGWLKALKDDPRLVVIAAAQAQKSADHILNRQRQAEEDTTEGAAA